MNAALLAIIVLVAFALGYRFYSKFLSNVIFQLQADEGVPSVEFEDGVDYVPSKRHVLWGHHFASIAGAAPIVGPAIAVIWGWLPALIWICVGTIFMGAMHDFSALVISLRHKGKSIGEIAGHVVNRRVQVLFLIVISFFSKYQISLEWSLYQNCCIRAYACLIFPVHSVYVILM
ncbi:MAG: carbon starvation CstA family protein, partial [bacterium]